jgi:hypothetical protein
VLSAVAVAGRGAWTVRTHTCGDWAGPVGRTARRPGPAAWRRPLVWLRSVRGPGALLVLVHQRPLLCHPQGLGTTATDGHQPIRGTLRGLRSECGRIHRDAVSVLEAHERWIYDEPTGVQTLRRLICLCNQCHTVTHFGLAQIKGQADEALNHLRAVTGMTDQQARAHRSDAFALWRARSTREWVLDLSMLTTGGVTLAPPPGSSDRVHIAEQTLRNLHRLS